MPDVDVLDQFSIREDTVHETTMLCCDVPSCHMRWPVENATVRVIFNKAMKHYEEAHQRG